MEVPKRFKILPSHLFMQQLGLEHDCYGVFYGELGLCIIVSEERGIDEYDGYLEDVEWLD